MNYWLIVKSKNEFNKVYNQKNKEGVIPVLIDNNLSREHIKNVAKYYESTVLNESDLPINMDTDFTNNIDLIPYDDSVVLVNNHNEAKKLAQIYAYHKRYKLIYFNELDEIATYINDETIKYINFFSINTSYKEKKYILDNFKNKNIGFFISNNFSSLSFFIAKSCSKLKYKLNQNQNSYLYINLVDEKRKHIENNLLELKTRKKEPFESLLMLNKIQYNIVIAAHGNGEIIYVGKNKITACDTKKTNEICGKNLKGYNIFLDSCFGHRTLYPPQHPIVFSTSDAMLCSYARSLILHPGVKENSSIECDWYIALSHSGYSMGETVRIINENLCKRTNEYGNYILLGDPKSTLCKKNIDEKSVFLKRNFQGNLEISFNNPMNLYTTIVPINNVINASDKYNYLVKSDELLYWIWDNNNNLVLFSPFKSIGPDKKVTIVSVKDDTLASPASLKFIEAVREKNNKNIKNLIIEWESMYLGAITLFSERLINTDSFNKYLIRRNKIEKLKNKIYSLQIQDFLEQSRIGMFPFTEKYSMKFTLSNILFSDTTCYCGNIVTIKELKHNFDEEIKRKIVLCEVCGEIEDKPIFPNNNNNNNNNIEIKLNVPYKIYLGESLNINIQGKLLRSKEILLGVTYFKCDQDIQFKFIQPDQNGKFQFNQKILVTEEHGYNSLKCFILIDNQIWYIAKPLFITKNKNENPV